jgi:hypothetical protein
MIYGHNVEQEEFRVVLVSPSSRMVLIETHETSYRLPRISIHKRSRHAEQLNEILHAKWNLRTIVLDFLPASEGSGPGAVIEVRTADPTFIRDRLSAVRVEDFDEQELTATERMTLRNILAGLLQDRGPFSKLGWMEEAQTWIREELADRQVDFDEDVRQYSASGRFALVRFGTLHGPAYWLKSAGAPNKHEFAITKTLSHLFPGFLPPLVAARSDWNAWVTEEAGSPLHGTPSLQSFEQATRCLAELQIASVRQVATLLSCGCFDQRMSVLRVHVPELMRYLEDAMARQTSTKVAPLSSASLHEIGRLLEDDISAMEAIGIPDALIHNDMNLSNILVDETRAVFTDWSEAGIGCPFLTFQHLSVQALEADETHTWEPQLKDLYKRHWRTVISDYQIERAFALSPPLAIASYLCGRDPSFTSPYRSDESVQSHARSLARHINRFVRSPVFLEALCR